MSGLQLLPTLHSIHSSIESPTLNMVRSQRLYSCSEADLPQTIGPTAMRDLFKLVRDARAFIGEGNAVFVTRKKVTVPKGLKRVPVEELLMSIEMPEVRTAVCEFVLNEVLPQLAPDEASLLSIDFLMELDRLLSIPLENAFGEIMTSYNFRSLKHRLCTTRVPQTDCERIAARLPHYTSILALFQDYNVFNSLV